MSQLYKKRGVDYTIDRVMHTLPSAYYQSEDIFLEEKEKIFYKRWVMACREEEVPGHGNFIIVPVGDERILVLRDGDGHIRAFYNVCRHRGTQLCDEDRGKFESGRIQCPYHAWTYDLNGQLVSAPLMKDNPGFSRDDYPLYSVHVGTWGGFIFLNLDENPIPFEEEMKPLFSRFGDWHLPDLRIAHLLRYHLACNWKLILQNYQECYHCPGVHPMLSNLTPFRSAVHDCMDGSVVGGYMELTTKRGSMTMDGQAAAPPVCDVHGEDLQRVHYYSIFPNMLFSPHPDFVMYHRIRPEAIDRSQNDCFFLLHPEIIADEEKMKRFQSAIEFWDTTNKQDWHVCEQMQKGLKSRRFKQGLYAQQEDILYALDKEILAALGHEVNI